MAIACVCTAAYLAPSSGPSLISSDWGIPSITKTVQRLLSEMSEQRGEIKKLGEWVRWQMGRHLDRKWV